MRDGQQTYLLLIGLFAIVTVVAVALARHRIVRRAYVGSLLGLMVVAGITGTAVWPFPSWHLFPTVQPRMTLYSEIRVADAEDRELRVPAEALAPLEPTPVRRLATNAFSTYTLAKQMEFAEFVLERTNEYGRAVLDERYRFARFPAHQAGRGWTTDDLQELGPFIVFRVYAIKISLSEDFSRIQSLEEELIFEHKS